eukprot:g52607.t1
MTDRLGVHEALMVSHPYKIGKIIGKGKSGTVFHGQSQSGETVAVKILEEEELAQAEVRALFQCQTEMSHRNVVTLLGYDQLDGKHCLIFEYVEGKELYELVKEASEKRIDGTSGGLPRKECLELFAQIVSAVEFLHENKVAHRDLKPDNIMVTADGEVKLVDFGVSQVFSRETEKAVVKDVVGSPHYLAPELCTEGELAADPFLADVWSLGVTLFVMLAGYLPWDGESLRDIQQQVRAGLDFPEHIDADLQDLLRRMLERDPSERCSLHTILQHPVLVRQQLDAISVQDATATRTPPLCNTPQVHSIPSSVRSSPAPSPSVQPQQLTAANLRGHANNQTSLAGCGNSGQATTYNPNTTNFVFSDRSSASSRPASRHHSRRNSLVMPADPTISPPTHKSRASQINQINLFNSQISQITFQINGQANQFNQITQASSQPNQINQINGPINPINLPRPRSLSRSPVKRAGLSRNSSLGASINKLESYGSEPNSPYLSSSSTPTSSPSPPASTRSSIDLSSSGSRRRSDSSPCVRKLKLEMAGNNPLLLSPLGLRTSIAAPRMYRPFFPDSPLRSPRDNNLSSSSSSSSSSSCYSSFSSPPSANMRAQVPAVSDSRIQSPKTPLLERRQLLMNLQESRATDEESRATDEALLDFPSLSEGPFLPSVSCHDVGSLKGKHCGHARSASGDMHVRRILFPRSSAPAALTYHSFTSSSSSSSPNFSHASISISSSSSSTPTLANTSISPSLSSSGSSTPTFANTSISSLLSYSPSSTPISLSSSSPTYSSPTFANASVSSSPMLAHASFSSSPTPLSSSPIPLSSSPIPLSSSPIHLSSSPILGNAASMTSSPIRASTSLYSSPNSSPRLALRTVPPFPVTALNKPTEEAGCYMSATSSPRHPRTSHSRPFAGRFFPSGRLKKNAQTKDLQGGQEYLARIISSPDFLSLSSSRRTTTAATSTTTISSLDFSSLFSSRTTTTAASSTRMRKNVPASRSMTASNSLENHLDDSGSNPGSPGVLLASKPQMRASEGDAENAKADLASESESATLTRSETL